MPVQLSRNSRLRFADLLTSSGIEFWDILNLPTIPVQSDDLQYQVVGSDRIDSLAQKFYGDPTLWWVIAGVNAMEILPTDLKEGSVIRIPSPRYIANRLFATAVNG